MKTISARTLLPGLACVLLLVACGGGGGGGGNAPPARPAAVIHATVGDTPVSAGGSVEVDSTVTLDASRSTTPAGTLSYRWDLTQQPEGSEAVIADPTSATTSFVPELPGQYLVSLVADNGTSNASVALEFQVTSDRPVARVLSPQLTTLAGQVQLDGRASLPPTGGDASRLRYEWRLVAVPPGSAVTVISAAEASLSQPRFNASVVGRYEVELQVSHDGLTSRSPARVVVDVTPPHTVPVAKITAVGSAPYERGQTIRLDAGESTAGSGTAGLQYRWTIATTLGATVQADYMPPEVSNTDQREVSFVPRRAGTYRATLVVYDGISLSTPVILNVNVVKPAGAANTAPVAVIEHLFGQNTFEVEYGSLANTLTTAAYDIDEANANLVREWTLLRPAGREADLTIVSPTRATFAAAVEPPQDGFVEYEFQLRVQDAEGAWSEPVRQVYRVLRGANRTPTAVGMVTTGLPTTMTGREVTLSGERSSDPDNNRLSYAWTLVDRPDGSQAELRNADQIRASFTPDRPGNYVARLWVTDEHGSRSISPFNLSVFAKSVNHPPQARPVTATRFTEEQPFLVGVLNPDAVIFAIPNLVGDEWKAVEYSSNAYDPDGDPLQRLWTMTSAPSDTALGWYYGQLAQCPVGGDALTPLPGGGFILNPWTQARFDVQLPAREWTDCRDGVLKFAPTVAGRYDFNLQVSDGSLDIGPFNFTLHAATRDNYPSLLLEEDRRGGTIPSGQHPLRQVTFPVDPVSGDGRGLNNYSRALLNQNRGAVMVARTYQMTAGARDYTLTDVLASSVHPDVAVRLVGLSSGQVIRRGETVEFRLEFTVPPESAGELPSDDEFTAMGRGIRWSFNVAERPGWSFALSLVPPAP